MRLTSVIMHDTYNFEDIELSLRKSDMKNRYLVRTIVGIDAEDLVPKFYRSGIVSGDKYYEYTMKPRDVVMRIALNPNFHINETASEIRDELYRLISANRTGKVQLQFKSGSSVVSAISGQITRFEVPYFGRIPELQITVHCDDPIFRSLVPVEWEIADLPSTNPVELPDNASTAPHGFSFKVEFTGTVATFEIQDKASSPDWQFKVTPAGGFVSGDELHFSSEFGEKLVYLQRTGDNRHLMDKLSATSVWPLIFPGNNVFYFNQIASIDWVELNYYSAYWGL